MASWSERAVWRAADYVLPVTHVLAGHVARAGVEDSRIVTIPNGVDLERFPQSIDGREVKRRLGIEDKLVLGFTGFVREWHGLDRAVNLLARHGAQYDLHLLVVGQGPGCDALERQASASGSSSSLTITGIVDRSEIARFVAAFDVALQPNVVEYASPLKIFEYLAMGKATVAPDLPNIREILTDGVNAALFDPSADQAMERSVLSLCEDPDLRERLGRAGRRLVLDRDLTWDCNARKVVELFATLVRGQGNP
jgi:glycosyltransferase involved in cell wall biosynthesis